MGISNLIHTFLEKATQMDRKEMVQDVSCEKRDGSGC